MLSLQKIFSMKKITLFLLLIGCILVGCRDFYPAQMKLSVDFNHENSMATAVGEIVDDGGCSFFTEQGICYGFYPEPSHIDGYSQIKIVEEQTEETQFSIQIPLPIKDTIYFMRAYVKTNAGIGYSEIVEVSTKIPEEESKYGKSKTIY